VERVLYRVKKGTKMSKKELFLGVNMRAKRKGLGPNSGSRKKGTKNRRLGSIGCEGSEGFSQIAKRNRGGKENY